MVKKGMNYVKRGASTLGSGAYGASVAVKDYSIAIYQYLRPHIGAAASAVGTGIGKAGSGSWSGLKSVGSYVGPKTLDFTKSAASGIGRAGAFVGAKGLAYGSAFGKGAYSYAGVGLGYVLAKATQGYTEAVAKLSESDYDANIRVWKSLVLTLGNETRALDSLLYHLGQMHPEKTPEEILAMVVVQLLVVKGLKETDLHLFTESEAEIQAAIDGLAEEDPRKAILAEVKGLLEAFVQLHACEL